MRRRVRNSRSGTPLRLRRYQRGVIRQLAVYREIEHKTEIISANVFNVTPKERAGRRNRGPPLSRPIWRSSFRASVTLLLNHSWQRRTGQIRRFVETLEVRSCTGSGNIELRLDVAEKLRCHRLRATRQVVDTRRPIESHHVTHLETQQRRSQFTKIRVAVHQHRNLRDIRSVQRSARRSLIVEMRR